MHKYAPQPASLVLRMFDLSVVYRTTGGGVRRLVGIAEGAFS
jgi:hypothetical protein